MLLGAATCHACAEATGNGSPQKSEHRRLGNTPCPNILILCIKATVEGVENQMVSLSSLMNLPGPRSCSAGMTQRVAPALHVMNKSKTDRSKVSSKTWDTLSPGPSL